MSTNPACERLIGSKAVMPSNSRRNERSLSKFSRQTILTARQDTRGERRVRARFRRRNRVRCAGAHHDRAPPGCTVPGGGDGSAAADGEVKRGAFVSMVATPEGRQNEPHTEDTEVTEGTEVTEVTEEEKWVEDEQAWKRLPAPHFTPYPPTPPSSSL